MVQKEWHSMAYATNKNNDNKMYLLWYRYIVMFLFIFAMALIQPHVVHAQSNLSAVDANEVVSQHKAETIWEDIEAGLSIAAFSKTNFASIASTLIAIRLDPKLWEFSILCASDNDKEALSLRDWAEKKALTVAINASMYLPDALTSTGYLQAGEHINNGRKGTKLGAFFVAEPQKTEGDNPTIPTLPMAAVLDKTTCPWEEILPHYTMVAQNYRLISRHNKVLWPENGARHSIAAIGEDVSGNILFLHASRPMTPHEFGAMLLALPLDLCTVMYVEGGPEAALYLEQQESQKIWIGKLRPELLGFGNPYTPLPNIIGARRRP